MKDEKGRFLPSKKYAQDLDHKQIIDMYLNGKSCKYIAEQVNSYPKKIQKVLKSNNIPFRKKRCYLSGPENPKYTGCEEIQGSYWASVKNGAKRRDLPFEITPGYAWSLFLKQDRKCRYSGMELFFSRNNLEHIMGEYTASLDRIDSSKGYIEGNVHWVHKRINVMKGKMSEQEFLNFCEAVALKNKDSRIYKTLSHIERY